MKLVKENIEFKRGQDPKKVLDIGMTIERLFEDTVKKLRDAEIEINHKSIKTNSFFIQFIELHPYSIHYDIGIGKEWTFIGGTDIYKFLSQKDVLEYTFDFLEDWHGMKINELKKKILNHKEKREKILKATKNL